MDNMSEDRWDEEEVRGNKEFLLYQRNKLKEEYRRGLRAGVIVGVLVLAAGLIGCRLLGVSITSPSGADVLTKEVRSKMALIEDTIDYYYLNDEDVDTEEMAEWIYSGMLASLGDPYSVYYTEADYTRLMETTEGSYYGIGAYLQQNRETGVITITKPMRGSPAEEAGLKAGDIIYMVNDEEVTGQDLSSVVAQIKGDEGSAVHMTIVREGENDYLEFDVERRDIEVPTVDSAMLEDNIGYIYIQEFDTVTYEQFRAALTSLENQGMEGLILDVRDNGGGSLQTVVQIADMLLPEGLIVYQVDKNGDKREYFSDEEEQFTMPIVMLVNQNSASASEILAGAIKDYELGELIGTTTFGKGIVQSILPLGDNTAVKLTISKYYTPSGNNIHDIGIEPDVEVELDIDRFDTERPYETDNQLDKAVEVLKEKMK